MWRLYSSNTSSSGSGRDGSSSGDSTGPALASPLPQVDVFDEGFQDYLVSVLKRHAAVVETMNSGLVEGEDMDRALADYAQLAPVAKAAANVTKEKEELEQLAGLLNEEDTDYEMAALARAERAECEKRLEKAIQRLLRALVPSDPEDAGNTTMTLFPGTGGREAALFAADLLKMYQNFAARQGWKVRIVNDARTDDDGIKKVTLEIYGEGAHGLMKFENGTHRVQRVPVTESRGRIHTSAAVVLVMPPLPNFTSSFSERDVKIDTFRAGGAGGQHVNTTDSAVRLIHIPTGITVSSQNERNQHQNKMWGMEELRARVEEAEREELQEKLASNRRSLLGMDHGSRTSRIRTYNWPQSRVTDHRINKTIHGLDSVISGGDGFQELLDALCRSDEAARLEEVLGQLSKKVNKPL